MMTGDTDVPHVPTTAHHRWRPLRRASRSATARAALLRPLLAVATTAALVTLATSTPAQAAVQAADDTPTRATQATRLADHLRTTPVYVTDQLPRAVPRSTAPDLAALAQRTGVPTYVLVLPEQDNGKGLLGAVHDRLGRNGLYVLLDESGLAEATAYGVRAPADDAATVTLYELPYDAGTLREFERFVDVIREGPDKAAAHADEARQRYGGDSGQEPKPQYISQTDRDNQSFVTGIALAGIPLLILLISPYVRRRRHTWFAIANKTAPAGTPHSRRGPNRIELALATVTAAAIALTASLTFDQQTDTAAPPPTTADMTSRVQRVSDGLRAGAAPLYSDPESPQLLDPARLSELRARIAKFERSQGGGPVFVAVVPQLYEDESAGDAEVFASALHGKLREDGVYVIADPLGGDIEAVNYGLRLDGYSLSYNLPDAIRLGDDAADEASDHHLGERLVELMTYLDKTPRTGEPGDPAIADPAPDPRQEHALKPLFRGDFVPGLILGGLAALLVLGVVAFVGAIVGAVRRRHTPLPVSELPSEAPTEPSAAYLRRTARSELRAFTQEFTPGAGGTRATDCLDAALLLSGAGQDGRMADRLSPSTLVAVIVLARAGRAALREEGPGEPNDLVCGVNPLHGPAVSRHHLLVSAEGRRRSLLPVCEMCRATAIIQPRTVHTLGLTLPDEDGGARMPYAELPGPLTAVRQRGIPQLIDQARESAGVR